MIIIDKDSFLARGSHRCIYLYNDNNKTNPKCLKIVFPEGQKILRRQNKHWYKRIRPISWFNENKKEIKAYKILSKKEKNGSIVGERVFEFVPRFYGIIKTNLGKAMIIDYFQNAVTIKVFIENNGLTKELKNKLYEMFKVFMITIFNLEINI